MDPERRHRRTAEMALASPSVRRMRTISVQILAAVVLLMTVPVVLVQDGTAVRAGLLAAALLAAAWAGYWTGLGRGLEALHATGAAQGWAEEVLQEDRAPEERP